MWLPIGKIDMAVTLITGASSGIGRSLARRFGARGEVMALAARREELLDSLAREIEDAGGKALAIPCDVTDRGSVHAAVATATRELGPIERLVANAGGGEPTHVDRFDAAEIERTLALNVVGTANCIEAVLPQMLERGAGHLVATSSLAAYRGLPSGAAYSAAKAALTNMMEALRVDLRGRGVDVSVICPGFVRVRPPGAGPDKKKKKFRPFRMELEDATARMERAIVERRPYYAFPRAMALAVAVGWHLPAGLYDRLLAGRGRSDKPT